MNMKNLFTFSFLTLILFSFKANSQDFTIKEMYSLVKNDEDFFDTYVTSKGFQFKKSNTEDNCLEMLYDYEANASRIFAAQFLIYTKCENTLNITWQFSDIKKYLFFKSQIKPMGFFYQNSKQLDDGSITFRYKKQNIILSINSSDNYNSENKKITSYQINFMKINEYGNKKITTNNKDTSKYSAQIFLPEEIAQIISLKVKGAYTIEAIANVLNFDLNKLRRWNPQFNEQTSVPGAFVKLTIPAIKLEDFLVQKEKILVESLKNRKI
jgi:hypothetical protein